MKTPPLRRHPIEELPEWIRAGQGGDVPIDVRSEIDEVVSGSPSEIKVHPAACIDPPLRRIVTGVYGVGADVVIRGESRWRRL